jgi:hypothetical protein
VPLPGSIGTGFRVDAGRGDRIEFPFRFTGWWLSLAERCVRDAEVGSSNLPHPTQVSAGHGLFRLSTAGRRAQADHTQTTSVRVESSGIAAGTPQHQAAPSRTRRHPSTFPSAPLSPDRAAWRRLNRQGGVTAPRRPIAHQNRQRAAAKRLDLGAADGHSWRADDAHARRRQAARRRRTAGSAARKPLGQEDSPVEARSVLPGFS